MSYDTGDKSVQCGRKVDAFKFWFMLKARGEDYMEEIVDNTFAMTDYLEELVRGHPGFRLVPEYSTRQCTNLGFWYIPERCSEKHTCEIKYHVKIPYLSRWNGIQ